MANGTSGTRGSGNSAAQAANPNLEAAKDLMSAQTYNLIKGAANVDLNSPVYKSVAMSIQDGLETAIEDIAKKDGNINSGSYKIEKVLNAAPIGTKIEYDVNYGYGQTFQMQSEKTGSNTWTQTWRVKNGNIFWTAEQKAGYIADDLWNHHNGS